MKLDIRNKENKVTGSIALPKNFDEPLRKDLIKRAVLAIQSHNRQSYGSFSEAGKRSSVRISKRRHDYRGTYGIGQSRTPRKVMNVRGTRFHWQGAFAPQTVGGRRAHAPKASKKWDLKINTKERLKALASALGATMDKILVKERGHVVPENYPFALSADFESITKTKELKEALAALGLGADLERADTTKVRAGKGTMRGRRYKTKKSLLLVTSQTCGLTKAAANIAGVDIISIKSLNAELLAPGTVPGRLTLFTQPALESLGATKTQVKKVSA